MLYFTFENELKFYNFGLLASPVLSKRFIQHAITEINLSNYQNCIEDINIWYMNEK